MTDYVCLKRFSDGTYNLEVGDVLTDATVVANLRGRGVPFIVQDGTGDNQVIPGTLGVTGALTPTGGIVGTSLGKITNIPIGAVAYGSLGTNAVHVAGTTYRSEIWLPSNKAITGIGVLNGDVVGTDKLIAALYSSAGVLLANSDLAGETSAGADDFQALAFTAPYSAVGPARFFVLVQCDGTTAKTRRIAASTYRILTSSATGVFGTLPASFTPPTTTTADVGPIAEVY